MTDSRVKLDGVRNPERSGGGGAQDRAASAKNFFPNAQRKGAALGSAPFEFGVTRSAVAAVAPEIGAVDLVSSFLQAIKQGDVVERRAAVAQGTFKPIVDVLVLVPFGLIALQKKNIGVAAIAEGSLRVLVDLLGSTGEPAFGALPGIVVAVELGSSKSTVISGE